MSVEPAATAHTTTPTGAPDATPRTGVAQSPSLMTALVLGMLLGFSGTGGAATAVALPELAVDVGFNPAHAVWILTSYALTLAVSTALYGRAVDRAGVRRPLTVGVVVLTSGAILATLAPTFELMVAARLLQGAGAGAAPVVTLAAVNALYPGRRLPKALAAWTATGVMFTAAGPVLGGLATELVGWQAAVLVPAASAVALASIWRRLPTGGAPGALDFAGALWVVSCAGGLVLLVQSARLGVDAAVAGAVLLAVALPLVVRQVRRRPDGFVPVVAVREPVVLRNSIAGSVIHGSWYGLVVAIPILLTLRGWSPVTVGVAMLPGALLGAFCGPIVAYALDRLGGTRALSISAMLCSVALACASLGAAIDVPALLILALSTVYLAMTLGQPALGASVMAAVPAPATGIAIGLSTFLFINGGSIGTAIAGLAPVLTHAGALAVLSGLGACSAVFLALAASRDAADKDRS